MMNNNPNKLDPQKIVAEFTAIIRHTDLFNST